MVQALRTSRRVGFYVPVEDLFEEDGAQLFEAKFDGVTVVLKGAKLPANLGGDDQAAPARTLGGAAPARRPKPQRHRQEFALPAQVGPVCRAILRDGGGMAPASNQRAEPPFSLWGRGVAGDWEPADNRLDLTALSGIEVIFHTQALSPDLRPAPSKWQRRAARPPRWSRRRSRRGRSDQGADPPRSSYSYRYGVGSVTAVGAALLSDACRLVVLVDAVRHRPSRAWGTERNHLLAWILSFEPARRHYDHTVAGHRRRRRPAARRRPRARVRLRVARPRRLDDADPSWWTVGKLSPSPSRTSRSSTSTPTCSCGPPLPPR